MEFTAKELERIIRVCGKSRVKKIKVAQIEIEFDENAAIGTIQESTVFEGIEVDQQPVQQQPSESDKQELYTQMMIDDPLALEEMTMRGDNQE